MKMKIEEKHIREAERILIPRNTFDDVERIPFIKCLETRDLLAVPGSGKTTALMAKLYCLSKQLPFENGSGVLVLAHTNHAVDEIEKELKKHCPNLFEYPNFVGTIQSFINKYLVLPYYQNKNRKIVNRIDTEIYNNQLKKLALETYIVNTDVKRLFQTPKINWIYNFEIKKIVEGKFKIIDRSSKEFIDIKKPIGNTKKENYCDWSAVEKAKVEENLIKLKGTLLGYGILSFEDCYFYANNYIEKFPNIVNVLQNRFRYIFIDEMQDLEEYQIEIIDKIFEESKSNSVIQRIGDINQSIYNSGKKVRVECNWKTRNEMYLTDSNRLTKSNAELVDFFTLDKKEGKFTVVGKRTLEKGDIKPHLILFKKETIGTLQDRFEKVIKSYDLHKLNEIKSKTDEKNKFKIIGWNGEWSQDEDNKGKLRLKDIFSNYSRESKSKKEYFTTLSKYIQLFDQGKKTLEPARKSILNALTAVLYYQGNRFSISQLIDFIKTHKKDSGEEIYEDFKLKLYTWSFELLTLKNYEIVFNSVKQFIENDFKNWFRFELNSDTKEFIATFTIEIPPQKEIIDESKLNIDIASVHSVKGQTHIATMYVETAYQSPVYESKKLLKKGTSPLFFNSHKCNGTYDRQALKMMYVGFSRPTHLLCFAVLEENVKDDLEKFKSDNWIIDYDLAPLKSKS